jgi:hypothetical protein
MVYCSASRKPYTKIKLQSGLKQPAATEKAEQRRDQAISMQMEFCEKTTKGDENQKQQRRPGVQEWYRFGLVFTGMPIRSRLRKVLLNKALAISAPTIPRTTGARNHDGQHAVRR